MSRKFTGEEDDWLDDAEHKPRPKAAKKPVLSRAEVLPPELGNAVVTAIFQNQSAARLDGQAESALCAYRMSTLAFGLSNRERSPVCVGDRVRVESGVIVGRCERRNRIARPAPNARDPLIHVLAANIDVLVVVASAREPEFSAGFIDRLVAAAALQKIPVILCINKTDLLDGGHARPWSHYKVDGIVVVELCAKNGRGTDALLALLVGKTAAFCGNSGVGKTSLLRRLLGDDSYGRTGAVNERSGKGRHTTSGAVMLAGPGGANFIDTPGVMNFGSLEEPSK
jgi:ribosome biogenesis GTPase